MRETRPVASSGPPSRASAPLLMSAPGEPARATVGRLVESRRLPRVNAFASYRTKHVRRFPGSPLVESLRMLCVRRFPGVATGTRLALRYGATRRAESGAHSSCSMLAAILHLAT
jgi:hypothetical protein